MAERTNRKEVLFDGQINAAKLENVLGQADKARQQLLDMLAEAEDDSDRGRLHYELWCMDKQSEHGRLALTIFQHLEATGGLSSEHKDRLSELEADLPLG